MENNHAPIFGMNIKPAAIVKKEIAAKLEFAKMRKQNAVIKFVNEVVVPQISLITENPEKFTDTDYYVFDMPTNGYDDDDFVSMLRDLLIPLGYKVSKTHDGGGLLSQILISWDGKLVF